jgi:hypothetical protein
MPGLERILRETVSPRTNLRRFIDGLATVTGALAPQSATVVALVDHAATTLRALANAGGALGQTVDQLPATEAQGTATLTHLTPVLRDAAALAREVKPATAILPSSSRRFAASLVGSLGPLRSQPTALADVFSATLRGIDGLAAFRPFVKQDFGSLFLTTTILGASLKSIMPAQINCDVAGLWTRNLSSTVSEGDAAGTWIPFYAIFQLPEMLQSPKPAPSLHANFYPNENATECESGNEPYTAGQHIGNPAGNQPDHVDLTSAPAVSTQRAKGAGLLDHIPGSVQP